MPYKIILYVCIILFFFSNSAPATNYAQYFPYIPPAEYFGKVILNNYSTKAGVDPVVFDHWLHRAKFTCRLCHIDIGFAMKAATTEIKADDNMHGYFCGACHDGKREIAGNKVFASCAENPTEEDKKTCVRCHSKSNPEQRKYNRKEFTENLPRLHDDLVDWEKAEAEGKINPMDFLEGISFQREPLKAQDDFSIKVSTWASDVIFSHKKHTVWNGCELCHPMIFPSSKQGTVKYTMFEIMEGEYCGVCHLGVAFSVYLCAKCHKSPVK